MLLRDLDAKNDAYDADAWADNEAMYAGGKKFRSRMNRFLTKNPSEPGNVYTMRKAESHYRPYVGSIVDYYVAWLFSANFDIRGTDSESGEAIAKLDDFYSNWKEDVGNDTDLTAFLRERFTQTLVKGASHWLIEFPDDGGLVPQSAYEFHARGLGNAKLRKVECEQVYDWECNEGTDDLAWVILHDLKVPRKDPRSGPRNQIIETWTIYDATNVETFQCVYVVGKRPQPQTDIPSQGLKPHGAQQVPLVTMAVPEGLAVIDRTKEAALANFRLSAALEWGIKRTCYAMPVFKTDDDEKPPIMGTGYYVQIGKDESYEWAAPPTAHLDVTSKEKDSAREEIYRITHQLALSVDNTKAAAVGRSGESKEMDALATRVVLNAFGACVKSAVEKSYEILSDGRGDTEISFSIEGLDSFDTQGVAVLIDNAVKAQPLSIPSKTYKKEVKTRVALAMIPDADQSVKDQVRKEVDEGVENEPDVDPDVLAAAQAHMAASKIIGGADAGTGSDDANSKQTGDRRAGGSQQAKASGNGSGNAAPAPSKSKSSRS